MSANDREMWPFGSNVKSALGLISSSTIAVRVSGQRLTAPLGDLAEREEMRLSKFPIRTQILI
jgi:hypothetical protein